MNDFFEVLKEEAKNTYEYVKVENAKAREREKQRQAQRQAQREQELKHEQELSLLSPFCLQLDSIQCKQIEEAFYFGSIPIITLTEQQQYAVMLTTLKKLLAQDTNAGKALTKMCINSNLGVTQIQLREIHENLFEHFIKKCKIGVIPPVDYIKACPQEPVLLQSSEYHFIYNVQVNSVELKYYSQYLQQFLSTALGQKFVQAYNFKNVRVTGRLVNEKNLLTIVLN